MVKKLHEYNHQAVFKECDLVDIEEMKNKIPGAKNNSNFYATGISLVAHMHSPFIPAAHFNTRFISNFNLAC